MSTFQIRVHSIGAGFPPQLKTALINAGIPDVAGLENYVAQHPSCVLMAGVTKDVARQVVRLITEAGGEAEQELSPSSDPMVLCTEINDESVWTPLAMDASASTI